MPIDVNNIPLSSHSENMKVLDDLYYIFNCTNDFKNYQCRSSDLFKHYVAYKSFAYEVYFGFIEQCLQNRTIADIINSCEPITQVKNTHECYDLRKDSNGTCISNELRKGAGCGSIGSEFVLDWADYLTSSCKIIGKLLSEVVRLGV